ncbi:MAG TPA: crotonase/enoyl-CoA hydratase family protein [Candidatus Dormibacteraeota bacterium]|jgi:enoyl-CoA hydratase|nr:crotonase/enoyl-CoA hydratase family protein [Candidatus Dormibacteraeota bacterium]
MSAVRVERDGPVTVVTIDRPEVRNAVDRPAAEALAAAFRAFDADEAASVGVLTGANGVFCAGADLHAVAGAGERINRMAPDGDAPLGLARLRLGKPVIAAVEGHAVAGGLELALWCDMRVASETAVFGVFCRRWGVPLIDGGTVRLPRIVGQGRALDMILTGRPVAAAEAHAWGLADRLVPMGGALPAAVELAHELAALPQACMRADRTSTLEQWSLDLPGALANEFRHGVEVVRSGETRRGAARFSGGAGRHGAAAPERSPSA